MGRGFECGGRKIAVSPARLTVSPAPEYIAAAGLSSFFGRGSVRCAAAPGTTSGGPMKKALSAFALVAIASLAMAPTAGASPPQTCNGTFTGATFDGIVVPNDGTCILVGS